MTESRSPLDLDGDTMRRLGTRVAHLVADHLATLADQPAYVTLSRTEAQRLLTAAAPEQGADFDSLVATLCERVFPYAAREPHPGFVAYVPSCPTFPAVLGDWLATGFNFFAGVWPVAAGPNALELTVLNWFRDWLGMPASTSGLLTSGGSNATFTAIVAARHQAVGEDAARIARLAIYTSDQAHSSVVRAGWLAGLPRAHVRLLPTDAAFRLRTDALEDAISQDRRNGLLPLAVIANAGTTNTGAVDPLGAIASICERERIWFHIDAAYGGFAILTERGRALLGGIERADSVTLDPHKWLFVPFECGCLLAREPARLKEAFQIMPEYLQDVQESGERVNFADYGEQLTRYSRAVKVWMSVSYFGVAALRSAMDRAMDLTLYAEQLVRAEPSLEVLSPPQFGILCFRAHPASLNASSSLDALNESVNAKVNAEGQYFISSTRLHGVFSLRICIVGFRTTEKEIQGVVDAVVRVANELEGTGTRNQEPGVKSQKPETKELRVRSDKSTE
ncbi:MAG: aminotransferase class V-fold PLP-dependent enzyme [Anaerolineae bacterium]|nr:aminotransferase class V-fold PLP-dependent enzyme [Gemmatimonadaceae bacterium]